LTIRVNLGENIHAVEADRGQIEQALLNLYLNAWQAMPGGGTLYLETQNISLDERTAKSRSVESGPYVEVSVRDTGTGMDSKTKERIFEPFFTTKVMGRGTGLGLASVYGIIKNHGGFINVHSEKGHGSTFSIYLPASKKAIIQNNMPAPAIINGTETILVVDDEGAIASVCKELLEVIGYKAIVAGNGREAVEIYRARREEIALVILDMIMPDMGGAETLRLLKEINPNGKVILSSGYSMDGQAEGVLIKGCEAFIQKPFDIHKLSRKIRDVLDQ
jgi:two-component system cell cycle sensor histidine kinase/response regulator CckA